MSFLSAFNSQRRAHGAAVASAASVLTLPPNVEPETATADQRPVATVPADGDRPEFRPTVGRIVNFTGDDGSGPYAALVVGVNGDGTFALATFGPRSLYFQPAAKFSEHASEPGTFSEPPRR